MTLFLVASAISQRDLLKNDLSVLHTHTHTDHSHTSLLHKYGRKKKEARAFLNVHFLLIDFCNIQTFCLCF